MTQMTREEILNLIAQEAFVVADSLGLQITQAPRSTTTYRCLICNAFSQDGEPFVHEPSCSLEKILHLRDELKLVPAQVLMRVRLKNHPDKWVGKKNPTYSFYPDQRKMPLSPEWHWYVDEKRARVWTNRSDLKRVVSLSRWGEQKNTFSQFEVVFSDGTIQPLDQVVGS